jgi:hypothetical protein
MPPVPSVSVTKVDGNTGAVAPASDGVLAVVAPSELGTQNVAFSYTRQDVALTALGNGPLIEYGAYDMGVAKKPFVGVRPTASTAASYGTIVLSMTGTSVPTAGATAPLDDFGVVVKYLTSGTIGVAGITYQYSLDNGNAFSAVQALGTANSITLFMPAAGGGRSSGASFTLGAGTVVAGDFFTCNTLHARMTTPDLTTALEALRITRLPFEVVLVDGEASAATIAAVDTWLTTLEGSGVFVSAILNTRHKNLPVPATETEAAFFTAMQTLQAGAGTSIRLAVGSDAGDLTSGVTGLTLPRPVALALAARLMLIPLGEDAAFAARGAISGFRIADGTGNPKWHDESLYPGLDDLHFVTLRGDGGIVAITNPNVFSPSTSDYRFFQHIRVMNRACSIAWQTLRNELSKGVGKKPADPITGGVYILEADARAIEEMVQDAWANSGSLKKQTSALQFQLARDDDLSSNAGATVNASVNNVALAYIKKFNVQAKFLKSLPAQQQSATP